MQRKRKKILIILSIIILLIAFLLGIIIKNRSQDNTYQIENKTDYEVTLKPNIYFNKKTENNYYIANSIKNIDIYFNYFIKSKTKENYSYDLTLSIKSYADNGTKLIWNQDFNIKNGDNIKQEEINIKENYNLDYEYYVNYVKSFEEYYNIKTETCLEFKLNIKINNKTNPYVLLTIPISESVIEITMKEDNVLLENKTSNIAISKIVISIFIIIAIIIFLSKILGNKDNDMAILKEYKDIIVDIQDEPKINNNNILYLTKLKDLLNMAINNNLTIFNYNNNYYSILDNTYFIFKKTK